MLLFKAKQLIQGTIHKAEQKDELRQQQLNTLPKVFECPVLFHAASKT